jgi:hypothetical protein
VRPNIDHRPRAPYLDLYPVVAAVGSRTVEIIAHVAHALSGQDSSRPCKNQPSRHLIMDQR